VTAAIAAAQNLIELIQVVIAQAHEEKSKD